MIVEDKIKLIASSHIFEPDFYQWAIGRAFGSMEDCIRHYLSIGEPAGLSPHPLFDARWYRSAHSSMLPEADGNALLDYLLRHNSRRDPHPLFSLAYYDKEYPDVAANGIESLAHFITHGWREGRNPNEFFDTSYYLEQYPDVAQAGLNPVSHFSENGWREGRSPSPNFDMAWYRSAATLAGLRADENPLTHFLTVGRFRNLPPRPLMLALDEEGGLSPADYDVWVNVLGARYRMVDQTPRRRVHVVGNDSRLASSGLSQVAPDELAAWLQRHAGTSHANPLLFVIPLGSQLRANALTAAMIRMDEYTKLSTYDFVLTDGVRIFPILLPGANHIYFENSDMLPPFCLDLNFALEHPIADAESLGEWFKRLIRAVRELPLGLRHVDYPAVEQDLRRALTGPAKAWMPVAWTRRMDLERIASSQTATEAGADQMPKVSIIICTKDCGHLLAQLVHSISQAFPPDRLDVVIVVNNVTNDYVRRIHGYMAADRRLKIVEYAKDYNFSDQCNLAASMVQGEYLLFLNDDIVPIGLNWLRELVATMADSRVGAVGPLLLYPNETIQHAGMYLGFNNVAGHLHRGRKLPLPLASGEMVPQSCSAVTGAVMLVRRTLYEQLNGFDFSLATYLQDVDFCLRLRAVGAEVVFNPRSVLFHMESISAAAILNVSHIQSQREREYTRFAKRWGASLLHDPFRNTNWTTQHEAQNVITASFALVS